MIQSYTHFLKRDQLYETEKPYSLRFTPPEGFPSANIKLDRRNINIHDIRGSASLPEFEKDGMQIVRFESDMTYDDYDDETKLKDVFLTRVANFLQTFLSAQHVQIFEHTVRKRHEIFPISTGEPYRYNQPTSIAHVDTTVDWAVAMARQLNPGKPINDDNTTTTDTKQNRIQCVNFWIPITGPVQDWPLAMCKPTSINPTLDFEPCDLVYPDYVVENRQVYFSERQEWCYLGGQMPDEAWVFLQSDTGDMSMGPGVLPGDVPPRESIEVRALVYYGGFEEKKAGKK